jgi:hypothetical protein
MNAMTPMSANETNAIKPITSVGKMMTIVSELHLTPKQSFVKSISKLNADFISIKEKTSISA